MHPVSIQMESQTSSISKIFRWKCYGQLNLLVDENRNLIKIQNLKGTKLRTDSKSKHTKIHESIGHFFNVYVWSVCMSVCCLSHLMHFIHFTRHNTTLHHTTQHIGEHVKWMMYIVCALNGSISYASTYTHTKDGRFHISRYVLFCFFLP